ncbi:MAG: hypothetical protein R6U44_00585 [Archaeoglobaceae archaeon]
MNDKNRALKLLKEKPRTIEELSELLHRSGPSVKWLLLNLPIRCEKSNGHTYIYLKDKNPLNFSSAYSSSNHYSEEQLRDICSICDKPTSECRSCNLYNNNLKNFEDDVRPSLGDVRVKNRAYINEEPKEVRSPDKSKNSTNKKKNSEKIFGEDNNISESGVRTSRGLGSSSKRAGKQAHLSSYQLNDVDVRILDLLSKNHYPAQVGRIIGLDRRRISERVNKLFKMELIAAKTSYPKYYRVAKEALGIIKDRIKSINESHKSVLGGGESSENSQPETSVGPPEVHNLSFKFPFEVHPDSRTSPVSSSGEGGLVTGNSEDVQGRVDSTPQSEVSQAQSQTLGQPMFACANCNKWRNRGNKKKCRCRKGRWTKMNNWYYFSTYFRGYEVSSNPSTIVVRGVKVYGYDAKKMFADGLVKAQQVVAELLRDYSKTTGLDYVVYYSCYRLAGKPHWVVNSGISEVVRSMFGGNVDVHAGEGDVLRCDASPDEGGYPQSHAEVVTQDQEKAEHFLDLFTGNYQQKLSRLQGKVESLEVNAAGGLSIENLKEVLGSYVRNLEERIDRLERLITEANGKYIREVNQTLNAVATTMLRLDNLEQKLLGVDYG